MATRYFQNKIAESIYVLLCDIIDKWGYSQIYTITNNSIKCNKTGSEFIFSGLYGKVDEIKSIEAIDILVIDEAHSMDEQMWEILIPTIRKEGSEIWCAFNPGSRLDFSWQKFVENPPEDSIVMKANYDTNIYLSETIKKEIEEMKTSDPEKYEHIYLGYANESSENSLFSYKDVDRAMKRSVTPIGAKQIGLDVGRVKDPSALCMRKGMKVYPIQERQIDGEETANWSIGVYNAWEADSITVDTVGAGGTTFDIIRKVVSFAIDGNNSMKATKPDRFKNKRAETYWNLAEDIRNHLLDLPDDAILAQELLATEYFYNRSGQVQIIDKDKIKETLRRSPNRADSLALTYFTQILPNNDFGDTGREFISAPNLF